MATARKTRSRGALAALLVPLVLGASALLADSAAHATSAGKGCSGGYGWPVKPFDRPHPVRGNFGDPRTVFDGRRSKRTIDSGDGMFQFHHGVDISAPDGSPVYAVADGTITRTHGDRVTVECPNGRAIQYWHITVTAVRVGQRAVAGKTVLGHILPKREHVHLTELRSGAPVNPLVRGHLTPYRDTTVPKVLGVWMGSGGFVAAASDMPAQPVPGRWHGFPVTPAVVSWRIETPRGRVVQSGRAFDVRQTIPATAEFWLVYARGSHQNWPVFSDGKARGMTGRYVFRLPGSALDRLAVGTYEVVVTAADTAGNRSSLRRNLRVDEA